MPVIKDISKLVSSHYISESLSNWQGEIEDIDTEQLVNVLHENQAEGLIKIENINEVNQTGSTCNSHDIQTIKHCHGGFFEESPVLRLGSRHQQNQQIDHEKHCFNIEFFFFKIDIS